MLTEKLWLMGHTLVKLDLAWIHFHFSIEEQERFLVRLEKLV